MERMIEKYFDLLWPICRSITGNGIRETFKILKQVIPLDIHEIPTGKKVYDWQIPNEWNIKDAFIITPNGKKICDFKKNNLHIVSYSIPVNGEFSFRELKPHLYIHAKLTNAVPYVTSYYKTDWGFCLSQNEFDSLPVNGKYKVVIDSELKKGHLTYGDLILKGKSKEEILFSTYVCHPSMANNELSGPLVTAFIYKKIAALKNRKYTYRFVFVPETIGAITYLHKYGKHLLKNLIAGYVVTCVGDRGPFTYKKSRIGNSLSDKVAQHVLGFKKADFKIREFSVGGSDERQYCSPGFNLPVGSLMRTPYKEYKEYHSSLDNKNLISFPSMEESINTYFDIVRTIELNENYISTNPFCEPQLSKRNLYFNQGGEKNNIDPLQLLHFLVYCDGKHDVIDIAEKYGSSALDFEKVILICKKHRLIK